MSVAMGTHNGERYLPAQLDTIARQTRPPDELVVSDDRSSDRTLEVLREFAARAPFTVDVSVAPRRLEVTRNFERAVSRCTGDVIVLSDQDDVWAPQRLTRLEKVFRDSPSVQLAFSDALLIDARGQPMGHQLWELCGFDRRHYRRMERDAFGQLMGRSIVSGCTTAFRADCRKFLLPFPVDEVRPAMTLIHDRWISIVLAAGFDVELIAEPLVSYRIHPGQRIGIPALQIRKVVPASLLRWRTVAVPQDVHNARLQALVLLLLVVAERLDQALEEPRRTRALARAEEASAHLVARATLPQRRLARVASVLRELATGRYHRYSLGVASVGADLLRRPGAPSSWGAGARGYGRLSRQITSTEAAPAASSVADVVGGLE